MAKEYIEREALMERLEYSPLFSNIRDGGFFIKDGVLDLVERQPAADVVEVRHGEWRSITDYGNGNCFGYCSACGTPQKAESATALKLFFKYCRNCGAKMDGKDEGA